MYEVAKFGGLLVSPLVLVFVLWLSAGWCLAVERRKTAIACACVGFVGLWVASTPLVAQSMVRALESSYPPLTLEATPRADAIVVLGGSVTGRQPPLRPYIGLNSASTRVWYAAQLYRAGKARWVVVAAGGEPESSNDQTEADAIAEMLTTLGVPANAIRLDTKSRNTRENAINAAIILKELGARTILLVTSAQHMPRAMKTFAKLWANPENAITAAPTDIQVIKPFYDVFSWIPSPSALLGVTRALKEYAGRVALDII